MGGPPSCWASIGSACDHCGCVSQPSRISCKLCWVAQSRIQPTACTARAAPLRLDAPAALAAGHPARALPGRVGAVKARDAQAACHKEVGGKGKQQLVQEVEQQGLQVVPLGLVPPAPGGGGGGEGGLAVRAHQRWLPSAPAKLAAQAAVPCFSMCARVGTRRATQECEATGDSRGAAQHGAGGGWRGHEWGNAQGQG